MDWLLLGDLMLKVATFAALMPWILAALFATCIHFGLADPMAVTVFGWLWLFLSPLWFTAGCIISYKEGQWSKK